MAGIAKEREIKYVFGDSLSGISVEWQDANENPIDLTDYLASMKVKDEEGTAVLHLDSDSNGGLDISAAEGKVSINATVSEMTAGLLAENKSYRYDLQVKSLDSETRRTLMRGKFIVYGEQTDV